MSLRAKPEGNFPNFHEQLHLGQLSASIKCTIGDRRDGGINTKTDHIMWDSSSSWASADEDFGVHLRIDEPCILAGSATNKRGSEWHRASQTDLALIFRRSGLRLSACLGLISDCSLGGHYNCQVTGRWFRIVHLKSIWVSCRSLTAGLMIKKPAQAWGTLGSMMPVTWSMYCRGIGGLALSLISWIRAREIAVRDEMVGYCVE
jgi:hypothetical protein